jgi:hypothetical protein
MEGLQPWSELLTLNVWPLKKEWLKHRGMDEYLGLVLEHLTLEATSMERNCDPKCSPCYHELPCLIPNLSNKPSFSLMPRGKQFWPVC